MQPKKAPSIGDAAFLLLLTPSARVLPVMWEPTGFTEGASPAAEAFFCSLAVSVCCPEILSPHLPPPGPQGCLQHTESTRGANPRVLHLQTLAQVVPCPQTPQAGHFAGGCWWQGPLTASVWVQSLSHCELITDDGIRHLGNGACAHDRLEVIELDNCPLITDASLEHLKSCHSLERIELYDCQQITRAGIKRLRVKINANNSH